MTSCVAVSARAQSVSVDASSPIITWTATSAGVADIVLTPAEQLTLPWTQSSTQASGNGALAASAYLSEADPDGFRVYGYVNSTDAVTTAFGEVALDLIVDLSFAVPSYARLEFQPGILPTVEGSGDAVLHFDIGADGTNEFSFGVGSAGEEFLLPPGTQHTSIRIVGSAFAGADSTAIFDCTMSVHPIERCVRTVTSADCPTIAHSQLHVWPQFDGSILFRHLSIVYAPYLVLGLDSNPAQLPIPASFGAAFGYCDLVPSPDLVVPFEYVTPAMHEVSIPNFVSPFAPDPFAFHAQVLVVDFNEGEANTKPAQFLVCP